MVKLEAEKLSNELQVKLDRCREILRNLGGILIGLSGGVDSTLLTAIAVETLGTKRILGATATGFVHAASEVDAAQKAAKQLGIKLIEVDVSELDEAELSRIRGNPRDRCYWCKKLIFGQFLALAEKCDLPAVACGTNADDNAEHRPGHKAVKELQICTPLLDAGMTKQDIRDIARHMGLDVWNKPPQPCLATRVPYDIELTYDLLHRIEKAEAELRKLGFSDVRLRDHGELAKIEVPDGEIPELVAKRDEIIDTIKSVGYKYVTLDLQGFRSGAMDE
jgi:pyridinium-3,5-biscarboxylic acid mononucleotide sulfurtransferase